MSKLNLRDLARTATLSREFQSAFVVRAAEDRAALTAGQEEEHGDGLFSKFATALRALRRAMSGFSPCPGRLCNGTDTVVANDRRPAKSQSANTDSHKVGLAMIEERASNKLVDIIKQTSGEDDHELFNAELSNYRGICITSWKMFKSGADGSRHQIEGHTGDARLALALVVTPLRNTLRDCQIEAVSRSDSGSGVGRGCL